MGILELRYKYPWPGLLKGPRNQYHLNIVSMLFALKDNLVKTFAEGFIICYQTYDNHQSEKEKALLAAVRCLQRLQQLIAIM